MATITLDYNARNHQAIKALDYILSLGYFRPKEKDAAKFAVKPKDDYQFEQLFGAWESSLSAEEQIEDLRTARHFRKREVAF